MTAMRVAVVGLGGRGRQWVQEVEATDGFVVAAAIDPDNRARSELARDLPAGVRVTADVDGLAGLAVDLAIVVAPAEAHVALTRELLRTDVPVLVEKPFTTSVAGARELVDLADERGVPLGVAQNYRYMRAWRTARTVIGSGRLGEVHLVAASYYKPPHDMAPSLASSHQSVLWGMGVHHIDALRYCLSADVQSVQARTSARDIVGNPTGATLQALLSFDRGIDVSYLATYESSGHEYFEGGQEFYARFVGGRGTLHVLQRWLVLCPTGGLPRVLRLGARHQSEEAVLLDQMRRAVRDGAPVPTSGRDNLNTVAAIEACTLSSQTGRSISTAQVLRRGG